MSKSSKKRVQINKEVDLLKTYTPLEAVETLQKYVSKNFSESFDIAVNLGVDPRHADQIVKGVCNLPHGLGKVVKVAVFAKGTFADDAIKAGADIVGSDDLMKDIMAGKIDFDRCIATPDMMPLVGRLGKVLGPRGLMPNPKTGTVTTDIKKAVTEIKAGSVEFKCDKSGIIHVGLGKINFEAVKLIENLRSFVDALIKAKPTGAKGNYILKTSLSTTQGMGLSIDIKEYLS
ncbi:MAG: large subunit ribosomal protein L1 [Alphaproteobacteria bacterium]|jgi:large subunit ribosomal protein L1